jgi:PAS domain S-box-containing protein
LASAAPDDPRTPGSLRPALGDALSRATGSDCLAAFVAALGEGCDVRTALVGVMDAAEAGVEAMAVWSDGRPRGSFAYDRSIAVAAGDWYFEELVGRDIDAQVLVALISDEPIANRAGIAAAISEFADRIACEVTRERAWTRLEASEAKYRSVFENAMEGVFLTTLAGQYLDANQSLARIYGYASPEELIVGLTDIGGQLYVDAGRREEFARIMQEEGSVADFQSRVRQRDGSVIWITEHARGIVDQAGALLYYEGTVVDITHRKLAEVELAESHQRLEQAHSETVMLLASAAEAHDESTGQHLLRVRDLSHALALEMGFDGASARAVGLAAALHDIGKLRVPDAILTETGALSTAEWDVMQMHTVWGAQFLGGRPGLELAADVARCHHERWDGAGYPAGLRGDDVPLAAAIVSVADSFDAITNDRPYRAARPAAEAIREVIRGSGAQFNPAVVSALVRLHARGPLPADSEDSSIAA